MRTEIIELNGIDFDVEFDYQPAEPEVRYYSDGSGYPGCAEVLEITEIKHNGVSFFEFFENYDFLMKEFEEATYEAMIDNH